MKVFIVFRTCLNNSSASKAHTTSEIKKRTTENDKKQFSHFFQNFLPNSAHDCLKDFWI